MKSIKTRVNIETELNKTVSLSGNKIEFINI